MASSYHTKIVNMLKENTSFTVLEEVPIKDALVKGYFDIVLPKLNLIIEVNGSQHYKPTDWSGTNPEGAIMNFQIQKLQDSRKRQYALDHGWNHMELSWKEVEKMTLQNLMEAIAHCLSTSQTGNRVKSNPTKSQAYSREQYRKWKEWKKQKEKNVSHN